MATNHDEVDDHSEVEQRLDGIERNVAWLREHDFDQENMEAAKRLGLIKGDVAALIRKLSDRGVSYAPMCRECGKLSPLGWGNNYADEFTARERASNHEDECGSTVDILEIENE